MRRCDDDEREVIICVDEEGKKEGLENCILRLDKRHKTLQSSCSHST